MPTEKKWENFEQEICSHFKSIGADAQTGQKLQGVRSSHNIDVLVKSKFFGQNVMWVIEAKHWNGSIPKERGRGFERNSK